MNRDQELFDHFRNYRENQKYWESHCEYCGDPLDAGDHAECNIKLIGVKNDK